MTVRARASAAIDRAFRADLESEGIGCFTESTPLTLRDVTVIEAGGGGIVIADRCVASVERAALKCVAGFGVQIGDGVAAAALEVSDLSVEVVAPDSECRLTSVCLGVGVVGQSLTRASRFSIAHAERAGLLWLGAASGSRFENGVIGPGPLGIEAAEEHARLGAEITSVRTSACEEPLRLEP